jgi:hypothetical protein
MLQRTRSRRRAASVHRRWVQVLYIAGFIGLIGVLVYISLKNAVPAAQTQPPGPQQSLAAGFESPARANYAYSVVPHGVYSAGEVREAMRRDSIVNAHYSGLNPSAFKTVSTREPASYYVSFRKQGRVFWTSRPVTIPRGEALLSDGQNLIRARCGNRLSTAPRLPVYLPAATEPASEELERVIPPLRMIARGTTAVGSSSPLAFVWPFEIPLQSEALSSKSVGMAGGPPLRGITPGGLGLPPQLADNPMRPPIGTPDAPIEIGLRERPSALGPTYLVASTPRFEIGRPNAVTRPPATPDPFTPSRPPAPAPDGNSPGNPGQPDPDLLGPPSTPPLFPDVPPRPIPPPPDSNSAVPEAATLQLIGVALAGLAVANVLKRPRA